MSDVVSEMMPQTLKRWGVVLVGVGKNSVLLGWAWWWSVGAVSAKASPWPAVWMTRKEARAAAKVRREASRATSPHWRFRVVRVEMTVRVVGRSR